MRILWLLLQRHLKYNAANSEALTCYRDEFTCAHWSEVTTNQSIPDLLSKDVVLYLVPNNVIPPRKLLSHPEDGKLISIEIKYLLEKRATKQRRHADSK